MSVLTWTVYLKLQSLVAVIAVTLGVTHPDLAKLTWSTNFTVHFDLRNLVELLAVNFTLLNLCESYQLTLLLGNWQSIAFSDISNSILETSHGPVYGSFLNKSSRKHVTKKLDRNKKKKSLRCDTCKNLNEVN